MLKWAAWIVLLLISAPNHLGKRLDPPKNGQCPNVGGDNIYGCPYFNANCRVCIGDHMDTVIYAWYLLILLICWAHTITNHHNLIFSQRHQKKIFIIQINVQTSALSKLSQHFPRSIIRAQQRWVIETDTDLNDWVRSSIQVLQCSCIIYIVYADMETIWYVFMENGADLNDRMDIGIIINPQYKC